MYCTKCGLHIEDDAKFCTGCGTPTDVDCQPTETTIVRQPAQSKDAFIDFNAYHQQPAYAVKTGPSMGWNNFLTSFLLYAGAVANLILAILVMTGMYFQLMADMSGAPSGGLANAIRDIYMEYSGIKSLNIMTGIFLIALAVYAVFARMRLASYKKDAVFHVPVFYLLSAILCIVFFSKFNGIMDMDDDPVFTAIGIVFSIPGFLHVLLNSIYYYKRRNLFNK